MVQATCQDTPPPATLGGHPAVLAALPLLSSLLAATPGAGGPIAPPNCEAAPAPLELTAELGVPSPVLCISPGVATNLIFDTPLAPGAAEVQGQGTEVQLAQTERMVALLPSARLLPGEWRKLTVHFGDGAAPSVAIVLLYVHPARAARQVEVRRQARTVESYQRELAEQRQEARQCEEEKAQLRTAQGKPAGLQGLLSAGLMGRGHGGVASENLFNPKQRYTVHEGSALDLGRVWSYRAHNRVALELNLVLLTGEQPWVAAGATLVDAHGRELAVLPLWQEAPVVVGKSKRVVVEAEATKKEAQGPCTLKLWEAGGARSVTLEGVVFPPAPDSAAP